jgi:hydroxymethylbilane synthase
MSAMGKGGKLVVGTRGSPLALAQTTAVCALLSRMCGIHHSDVEVKVITTTGDRIQDRLLADVGGKGLFTKEIEIALAAGEIDLAVHSAKDMPTVLPDGLVISAYPEREDARDVLISRGERPLAEMPAGASLGTASLRREAQVRRLRPDIEVRALRGNVQTRLRKLQEGVIDATILGMAGLRRLKLTYVLTEVLPIEMFLPAVGQGAVAIETREDDEHTRDLLQAINHAPTEIAVTAERAFLRILDGSCRTPIAGHAVLSGSEIRFRGMVLRADGSDVFETWRTGSVADATRLGLEAGMELKRRAETGALAQAG